MRVYISLPINGRHIEDCRQRAEKLKMMIERRGHTPVSPLDPYPGDDEPCSYARHMGRDIELLLGCNAILRATGWGGSYGCALESECARIYGKRIYDHIAQLPPADGSLIKPDPYTDYSQPNPLDNV